MSTGLPIACTLDRADLAARLGEIAAVGRTGLRSGRRDGARAELRFTASVRDRLARIVEAEAACCPFLELELQAEGDGLLLVVAAPSEAEPVVADLVGAFGL